MVRTREEGEGADIIYIYTAVYLIATVLRSYTCNATFLCQVGLPVSCWLAGWVTDGVVVKFAEVAFARVVGAWVITVCAGVESLSVVVCVVEGFPVVCACVVTVCVVEGFPVVCACVVTVCAVEGFPVVCAWVVDEINVCVVADIVDLVSIKVIFYSLGVALNDK